MTPTLDRLIREEILKLGPTYADSVVAPEVKRLITAGWNAAVMECARVADRYVNISHRMLLTDPPKNGTARAIAVELRALARGEK